MINVYLAPNQPIRMISEGSCDAEENSALLSREINTFFKYIKIE